MFSSLERLHSIGKCAPGGGASRPSRPIACGQPPSAVRPSTPRQRLGMARIHRLRKNSGLEPIWEGHELTGAAKPFTFCHSEPL